MKRPIACLLVVIVCLVAIRGLTAEQEKATTIVKPCVTITGADSHVSECGYHRIASMKEWIQVWQKHEGHKVDEEYDLYYNPLGVPLVDFDNYMVIAIFQGSSWNSAGLSAVSISQEEDRIVFRFDDKSYQTLGPDGGGKRVTVYGFFVVRRSAKAVILEENVQGLKGKPPVWKERITFPNL